MKKGPYQVYAEALNSCREDRSYIITGGLGGFGLALAVWLSNQGARNLVMTSKRGMRTGGQRKVIEMLRSRGVNVSHLALTFSLKVNSILRVCVLPCLHSQ